MKTGPAEESMIILNVSQRPSNKGNNSTSIMLDEVRKIKKQRMTHRRLDLEFMDLCTGFMGKFYDCVGSDPRGVLTPELGSQAAKRAYLSYSMKC